MARKTKNPQLKKLFETPQRKTYTIVGVTIVTVGVFVFMAIRPALAKIASISSEIEKKNEYIEKLDKKTDTIRQLARTKATYASEIETFHRNFPDSKDTGPLVANLNAIGEKYDLQLSSFNISTETEEINPEESKIDPESVEVFEINATFEGDIQKLGDFVSHLERYPRVIDIQVVSFGRDIEKDLREKVEQEQQQAAGGGTYTQVTIPQEGEIGSYQVRVNAHLYNWKEIEEEEE